jgi:hypothetical protein
MMIFSGGTFGDVGRPESLCVDLGESPRSDFGEDFPEPDVSILSAGLASLTVFGL